MADISALPLMHTLTEFGIALCVGLSVGIERSINNRDQVKKTSVRDFSLVAVLAFVSSLFYNEIPLAWTLSFVTVLLFALTSFIIENWRSQTGPVGMTTLIALPITFLVASLTNFGVQLWTIATIMFAVLMLLELKEHMHRFVSTLERREIMDFAVLIGIAISITPLIPPGSKLPIPLMDFSGETTKIVYQYVGIEGLWKVVIMVSLMSFVAHFITKYTKGKNALILATFFGGLVSSLATILMLLRNDKANTGLADGETSDSALTSKEIFLGFVAANTGSIVKDVAVLRMVVGEEKFSLFIFPMVASLVLFFSITAYAFSLQGEPRSIRITSRPLPLGFIFKFSGIVTVLIVIMAMVKHYLGNGAVVPTSFLSGMVSSAAAITSIGSSMQQEGGISGWVASLSVVAALLGSIGAKYFVVLKRLGLKDSLPFLLPILSLASIALLAVWLTFNH